MEKRCRPPQGHYKSLETAAIFRDRILCDRKPDVLGIYQAERIVAKKIKKIQKFEIIPHDPGKMRRFSSAFCSVFN